MEIKLNQNSLDSPLQVFLWQTNRWYSNSEFRASGHWRLHVAHEFGQIKQIRTKIKHYFLVS